jgi:hypothetical protein
MPHSRLNGGAPAQSWKAITGDGTLAEGSRIFWLKGEPFFEGSNTFVAVGRSDMLAR